jgi:serine protease
MKKATIASLAVVASGAEFYKVESEKKIANSYVVRLNDSVDRHLLEKHVDELRKLLPGDFEPHHVFHNLADYKSPSYSVKLTEFGLERLLQNEHVKFIEEDQMFSLYDECVSQSDEDWGTARINRRNYTSTRTYTYDYTPGKTGLGVDAYVLDTGIYCENNDFVNKRVGTCTFGYSSITNTIGQVDTTDGHGHGTHCAGTVGGQRWGAAKEASLIAVKVLSDSGSGSNSGIIAGINWMIGNVGTTRKPSVANMSLGGGFSQASNDAVASATASGITVIVAAGNDNSNACNYSPASEPSAVTVAASDMNNARASYSNYGSCVDMFGPGSSITSAWIGSPSATNTISGTSMAAPQVCGTAAKFLSEDKTKNPAQLTQELFEESTKNVVTDVRGSPNLMAYGYCD